MILVDDTKLDTPAKISALVSLPDLWESLGAPRTNRLAVLLSEDESLHEDFRFFESVCRNRGWYIRVFNKREDAIEWLLKNKLDV